MTKENSLLKDLVKSTRALKNPTKARNMLRFFKTGVGQYGEGDIFLGLVSAQVGEIVKKYRELPLSGCLELLKSKYHEERMIALQILVYQFKHAKEDSVKKKIFNIFIKNTKYINNWDLVDCNVEHVIGEYLYDKPKDLLYKFALSKDLWERRIAIISTFNYIKKGEAEETLKIAEMLLNDKHDLIHKAVGWMLREVGKRCDEKILLGFLDKYSKQMPRTMLRYSLERLDESKRKYYMLKEKQ